MKRFSLFLLVAAFVGVQFGCDSDHKSVPKSLPAGAKPFTIGSEKGVGGGAAQVDQRAK